MSMLYKLKPKAISPRISPQAQDQKAKVARLRKEREINTKEGSLSLGKLGDLLLKDDPELGIQCHMESFEIARKFFPSSVCEFRI